MQRLGLVLILLLAGGCTQQVALKEPGDHQIGRTYAITISQEWSHVGGNPQRWTIDGPSLGLLRTWSGLRSGQALLRKPGRKTPAFRATSRAP